MTAEAVSCLLYQKKKLKNPVLLTSVSVYHVETLYYPLTPRGHCNDGGCDACGHRAPHHSGSGGMQIVHAHFFSGSILFFL